MDVITAPEKIPGNVSRPTVFLAGGITNCPNWQREIIEMLKDVQGTILNPRRENFPVGDPNSAVEQITWEFNAIEMCDIFSIWFCAGPSDQPICMYELGRNLLKREDCPDQVLIGIEPGYKREMDVRIQADLASTPEVNNLFYFYLPSKHPSLFASSRSFSLRSDKAFALACNLSTLRFFASYFSLPVFVPVLTFRTM